MIPALPAPVSVGLGLTPAPGLPMLFPVQLPPAIVLDLGGSGAASCSRALESSLRPVLAVPAPAPALALALALAVLVGLLRLVVLPTTGRPTAARPELSVRVVSLPRLVMAGRWSARVELAVEATA